MMAATVGDEVSNEGRKLDQAQTTKPMATAAVAALIEASRQNSAAMIAGRNCATPVNEISRSGRAHRNRG
jgi:hypothetical protein